jgi:hypothetical protein
MSLVQSFFLHPTTSSGKHTLAKQRHQVQSSSITSTIKQQQPLHTKLGAAADDDCIGIGIGIGIGNDRISNNDEILSTTSPAAASEKLTIINFGGDDGYDGLGEYDPSENLPKSERGVPNVGNPQLRVKERDWSVTDIMKELAAINQQGPQKYCILGTRHCSYLHQQIIELLYVLCFFSVSDSTHSVGSESAVSYSYLLFHHILI